MSAIQPSSAAHGVTTGVSYVGKFLRAEPGIVRQWAQAHRPEQADALRAYPLNGSLDQIKSQVANDMALALPVVPKGSLWQARPKNLALTAGAVIAGSALAPFVPLSAMLACVGAAVLCGGERVWSWARGVGRQRLDIAWITAHSARVEKNQQRAHVAQAVLHDFESAIDADPMGELTQLMLLQDSSLLERCFSGFYKTTLQQEIASIRQEIDTVGQRIGQANGAIMHARQMGDNAQLPALVRQQAQRAIPQFEAVAQHDGELLAQLQTTERGLQTIQAALPTIEAKLTEYRSMQQQVAGLNELRATLLGDQGIDARVQSEQTLAGARAVALGLMSELKQLVDVALPGLAVFTATQPRALPEA